MYERVRKYFCTGLRLKIIHLLRDLQQTHYEISWNSKWSPPPLPPPMWSQNEHSGLSGRRNNICTILVRWISLTVILVDIFYTEQMSFRFFSLVLRRGRDIDQNQKRVIPSLRLGPDTSKPWSLRFVMFIKIQDHVHQSQWRDHISHWAFPFLCSGFPFLSFGFCWNPGKDEAYHFPAWRTSPETQYDTKQRKLKNTSPEKRIKNNKKNLLEKKDKKIKTPA